MTRHLLRIDSTAGLLAGTVMLVLSGWLSALYALPRSFLIGVAAANLAYGSYSGVLSRMPRRPSAMIVTLVVANGTWASLCLLAAWHYRDTVSAFGLVQLVGEALFVGGLAMLEWRARVPLRIAST